MAQRSRLPLQNQMVREHGYRMMVPAPGQGAPAAAAPGQHVRRPVSLSEGRMLRGIFMFLILAGLCLAHVTLQFMTLDLKVQHAKLQERGRALQLEEQRLLSVQQAMAEESRVREAAIQAMHLREGRARERVTASVPREVVERYSSRKGDSMLAAGLPEAPARGKASIGSALLSFIDVGVAQAAPVPSASGEASN